MCGQPATGSFGVLFQLANDGAVGIVELSLSPFVATPLSPPTLVPSTDRFVPRQPTGRLREGVVRKAVERF